MLVVLAFAGYWWLATPGPQVDTEWFIGAETVAILHLDRPFEDEGVREFISTIGLELQEKQIEAACRRVPAMAWLATLFSNDKQDIESDLEDEAPRQATLILEAIEGADRPAPAVVLNLKRFPRLFRLASRLYSSFSATSSDFQGLELIPFEEGEFTFVENTLVWSQSRKGLEQVLRRLGQVPQGPEASNHPPGEGFSDPRWDFFASLENRAGTLPYILELSGEFLETGMPEMAELPQDFLESIESLDVGLDIRSSDSASILGHVLCSDLQECRNWRSFLENLFSELSYREATPLKSYRLAERGASLQVELELVGFRKPLLDYLFQNAVLEEESR